MTHIIRILKLLESITKVPKLHRSLNKLSVRHFRCPPKVNVSRKYGKILKRHFTSSIRNVPTGFKEANGPWERTHQCSTSADRKFRTALSIFFRMLTLAKSAKSSNSIALVRSVPKMYHIPRGCFLRPLGGISFLTVLGYEMRRLK